MVENETKAVFSILVEFETSPKEIAAKKPMIMAKVLPYRLSPSLNNKNTETTESKVNPIHGARVPGIMSEKTITK